MQRIIKNTKKKRKKKRKKRRHSNKYLPSHNSLYNDMAVKRQLILTWKATFTPFPYAAFRIYCSRTVPFLTNTKTSSALAKIVSDTLFNTTAARVGLASILYHLIRTYARLCLAFSSFLGTLFTLCACIFCRFCKG